MKKFIQKSFFIDEKEKLKNMKGTTITIKGKVIFIF